MGLRCLIYFEISSRRHLTVNKLEDDIINKFRSLAVIFYASIDHKYESFRNFVIYVLQRNWDHERFPTAWGLIA